MVLRVLLLRHDHVEGIDPPRFRGLDDLPLSELGQAQARAAADHLAARYSIDDVLTSPLSRCVDTRSIACPYVPSRVLPELTDFDYGDWQGRLHAEVQAEQPDTYAAWHTVPDRTRIPGGETLWHAAERAAHVLDVLADRPDGGCTLVVSHNSTIRLVTLLALGLPISRYWHVRQDPCGLSVLDRDRGGDWRISSLNETAHLQAHPTEMLHEPGDERR